ncbi:zinc finger protein [Cricetulus griseus]|nr:zinc finger protein [Cricetulus griseus]
MYQIFSIHSSVKGYLGCFQVLAITNNTAVNIVEQMSLLYEYEVLGYMPNNGIVWSCGILIPIFLKNHHTDFQSDIENLETIQLERYVPIIPVLSKIFIMKQC